MIRYDNTIPTNMATRVKSRVQIGFTPRKKKPKLNSTCLVWFKQPNYNRSNLPWQRSQLQITPIGFKLPRSTRLKISFS